MGQHILQPVAAFGVDGLETALRHEGRFGEDGAVADLLLLQHPAEAPESLPRPRRPVFRRLDAGEGRIEARSIGAEWVPDGGLADEADAMAGDVGVAGAT